MAPTEKDWRAEEDDNDDEEEEKRAWRKSKKEKKRKAAEAKDKTATKKKFKRIIAPISDEETEEKVRQNKEKLDAQRQYEVIGTLALLLILFCLFFCRFLM